MGYANYNELRALPAEAYLDWEQFDTVFDQFPENVAKNLAESKYEYGLKIASEYDTIYIAMNSVWSASGGPNGGALTSSEGIGYHACTKDLLHGFLDGEAKVVVYREGQEPTVIKEYGLNNQHKFG
jgi:hypothetical protein